MAASNYTLKTLISIMQIMKVSNEKEFDKLLSEVKIIQNTITDEDQTVINIAQLLLNNDLFLRITTALLAEEFQPYKQEK
jgi:hypothetical protein